MSLVEMVPRVQQSTDLESFRKMLRARAVEEQASAALRASHYHSVRQLTCEVRSQVLILKGTVPNFFMKQIAQTVVRDLLTDGLVLDNQVLVD